MKLGVSLARLGRTFCALLAIAAATAILPAAAKSLADPDPEVAGQILLRLRSAADLPALLARYPVALQSRFGARPIYRLSVVGQASVRDVIAALVVEPAVLNAEPNALHGTPEARVNIAWSLGTEADFANQWAPQALHLSQAHALSQGAGVRVAVLDTGVDATHPLLASRVVSGYDFVDDKVGASEVPGSVSYGHGTHVAGLIAMAAPAATILPLRVLDTQGQGNAWVIAEAMLHAVDPDRNPATPDGAQVINLSLGTMNRTELLDAVIRLVGCDVAALTDPLGGFTDPGYNGDRERCATTGGALVVAAAGNDASRRAKQYPAAEGAYALLPITASTAANRLAAFANHGSWVDLAAPGDEITSSVPGGEYRTWSGTSMAAPLASAVAALVIAQDHGIVARDVARRLETTSVALCGTNAQRRIDAATALGLQTARTATCP